MTGTGTSPPPAKLRHVQREPSPTVTAQIVQRDDGLFSLGLPALLAYMFKDLLLKKLDGEIDAEADDKAALSHDVRQKREAEVLADLLACERDESWLVFEAQRQQLAVEHRADVDVRALLGVVTVPAPAVAAGTTPGFVLMRR